MKELVRGLLYWACGYLRLRYIDGPDGQPYNERHFLFQIPGIGITAYIHRFVGSDPGKELHNHPWNWAIAIPLSGWYSEKRYTGALDIEEKIVKFPNVNVIWGDTFHRVDLPPGGECYTLFIHGPWVKVWGFMGAWLDVVDTFTSSIELKRRDNEDTGDDPLYVYRVRAASVDALKRTGRMGSAWWRNAVRAKDLRIKS